MISKSYWLMETASAAASSSGVFRLANGSTSAPDPKLTAMFAAERERFKALYGAVKEEFRR